MSRRFISLISVLSLVVFWLAAGPRVSAQQPVPSQEAPPPTATDGPPPSYETPPAITLVDGSARLVRQGQSQAAVASMPLVEGDRIVTDSGRVAVTFPDGSLLHVDRNTTVDFLSMNLMRMLDGRVILVTAAQRAQGGGYSQQIPGYQIDAPAASVRVQTSGEYKVSNVSGEVELDVVTGTATLASDQGSVQVEAGERSFARQGEAPSYAEAFNSARLDDFDEWSTSQRQANTEDASAPSSQYLPSELDPYASTFDQYGRWESDPSYGYVWYPTVTAGWRPYYNGYWDNIGPYGWTWIGFDRWAWPTHHFGRWGFRAGLWFWIPQRLWGPAWVSWAYSPGYYGWCPLDFYNRPLIGFSFGFGGRFRGAFDPWRCWTVIPRHRFGPGFRVASYAVDGGRLPASARDGFAIRRGGPDGPGPTALARNPNGGRAVPRALTSMTTQARPREAMFSAARSMPRGGTRGASALTTTPRSDSRSLRYSAPGERFARGGSAGTALPRGSVGPQAPNRTPSSLASPRGSDRSSFTSPRGLDRPSSSTTAQPRSFRSTPGDRPPTSQYATPRSSGPVQSSPAGPRGGSAYSSPRYAPPSTRGESSYTAPRPAPPAARGQSYASPRYSPPASRGQSYAAPRYSPPATRGQSYAAPRYSPPSTRGPSYAAPRYSAPAPRYAAPSSPRYSAPAAPRSYAPAAPRYSAPPSPRYSAPASPRYSAPSYSPRPSAPSYSAPRGPSGGYAAPRAGGGSAPRSAPSGRPAPSGGGNRGGGRRGGR